MLRTSEFIMSIGLWFYFLVLSFSGLGSDVILDFENDLESILSSSVF